MALVFGAATSDRVEIASAANNEGLDPCAWAIWCYPTTLTINRRLFERNVAGGDGQATRFQLSNTSGGLRVVRAHATTSPNYNTGANTPLVLNTWNFLGVSYDSGAGAGNVVQLCRGSLTALATAVGMTVVAEPSGALTSEASTAFRIGNERAASPSQAFRGRIAYVGWWSRAMTVAEFQAIQFRRRSFVSAVLHMELGYAGTGTQPDWSGNSNSGTVTGATVGDHVPIPFRRARGLWMPTTAAVAGRTTKNTRAWPLGVEIGMNWRGAA